MTGTSIDFSLPVLAGARTGLHTVAAMSHRLVVASRHTDPRSTAATRAAEALGYRGVSIEVADLFVTDEPLGEALRALLIDPLVQVEDGTPAGEAATPSMSCRATGSPIGPRPSCSAPGGGWASR